MSDRDGYDIKVGGRVIRRVKPENRPYPDLVDGDTARIDGTKVRGREFDTNEATSDDNLGPGGWQAREALRDDIDRGVTLSDYDGDSYDREVWRMRDADGQDLGYKYNRVGLANPSFDGPASLIGEVHGLMDRLRGEEYGNADLRALSDSAEQARRRRFGDVAGGRLNDRFVGLGIDERNEGEGWGSRALSRGTATVENTVAGTAKIAGRVLGVESLVSYGEEGLHEAFLTSLENPAEIASMEEAEGAVEFLTWAAENSIAELPSLGLDVAALFAGKATGGASYLMMAGAGKALARRLGGAAAVKNLPTFARAVKASRVTGDAFTAGSMFAQSAGNTEADLRAMGVEDPDDIRTLQTAAGSMVVNLAAFKLIADNIAKSVKAGTSTPADAQNALLAQLRESGGRVLKASGEGFAAEFLAGAGDGVLNEFNRVSQVEGYEFDPNNVLESAVTGGVVGTALAGSGTTLGETPKLFTSADRRWATEEEQTAKDQPAPHSAVRPGRTWLGDDERADTATNPEPPTDQVEAAQPDVGTANTSGQRAEETATDGQVAFEEGVNPIAGYRLREHIAAGKQPAYQIAQDGTGVTVVSAGTGVDDIGSVQVTLTPDESRALKRAQQDRELADTTEEIEAARSAERATVAPAIERAVGLDESTSPPILETQTEESPATREREQQQAEQVDTLGYAQDKDEVADPQQELATRHEAERRDAEAAVRAAETRTNTPEDLVRVPKVEQADPKDAAIDASASALLDAGGPSGRVASDTDLIEQAKQLGIETDLYLMDEVDVNADALRSELQLKTRASLPSNPDITLNDILTRRGVTLSDLEIDQLKRLAHEFSIKDLPKKVKAVSGVDGTTDMQARQRYRGAAKTALEMKFDRWRTGKQKLDGENEKPVLAPSDMSLVAQLFPELKGLRRRQRESQADYQSRVRDSLPTQRKLRERLNQMTTTELAQAVELTRSQGVMQEVTGKGGLEGVNVEYATERRVDRTKLRAAIAGRTPNTKGRPERTQEGEPKDELVLNLDENLSDDEAMDRLWDEYISESAGIDDQQGESIQFRTIDEMPQPLGDDVKRAASGALFHYVTGEAGRADEAAGPMQTPARWTALDGEVVFRTAMFERGVRSPKAQKEVFEGLRELALEDPANFGEEVREKLISGNLDPVRLLKVPKDLHAEPQKETARGSESRFSGPGMTQRPSEFGPGTTSEQHLSDRIFFRGLLSSSLFGVEPDSGAYTQGGAPIDLRQKEIIEGASHGAYDSQVLESIDRYKRLKGRNLIPSQYGGEPIYLDAVALTNFAQGGQSKPETPRQAFENLLTNIARGLGGAQASGVSDSLDPSVRAYMTELPPHFQVPDHTVIFEDGSPEGVTYAEAERAYYEALGERQEATRLATEKDGLDGDQSDRREALRLLISRAKASLMDETDPDVRLATAYHIVIASRQAFRSGNVGEENRYQQVEPLLQEIGRSLTAEERSTLAVSLRKELAEAEAAQGQAELAATKAVGVRDQIRRDFREQLYAHVEGGEEGLEALNDLRAVVRGEEARALDLERQAGAAAARVAYLRNQLSNMSDRREDSENVPQVGDDRTIDLRPSLFGNMRLSDAEAAGWKGVGAARDARTLLSDYSQASARVHAITQILIRRERTASDVQPGEREMVAELMGVGYDYDTALEVAQATVEVTNKLEGAESQEASARGRHGDMGNELGLGFFSEGSKGHGDATGPDGTPLNISRSGDTTVSAPTDPSSPHDPDYVGSTPAGEDAMGSEQEASHRRLRTPEAESLAEQMQAWIKANPNNFTPVETPNEWSPMLAFYPVATVRRGSIGWGTIKRFSQRTNLDHAPGELVSRHGIADSQTTSHISTNVGLALQQRGERPKAAMRAQAHYARPEDPRQAELDAFFGKRQVKVVGTEDSTVGDYVEHILADFRSTDRPVLVTVGENAQQISRMLKDRRLVGTETERRKVSRLLGQKRAGERPMFVDMGDFVMVSMPPRPASRRQADNLRFYHQLGHELGHLVYDDYTKALHRDTKIRTRLYNDFEEDTGLDAVQNSHQFTEWFADRVASEALGLAMERAQGSEPAIDRMAREKQERISGDLSSRGADIANERLNTDQTASPMVPKRPQRTNPFRRLASLLFSLWDRVQYATFGEHDAQRFTRSRSFAVNFVEAIHKEQLRARRGEMRRFDVRFYDGGTAQDANRAGLLRTRAASVGKKAWGNISSANSMVGRMFRSVQARLEEMNPELAAAMFQRSASDRQASGVQAFDQMTRAHRDSAVGALDQFARRFGGNSKKDQLEAIDGAMRELVDRRRTDRSDALANLIDGFIADSHAKGLRGVQFRDNFVPTAIDAGWADTNRGALLEMIAEVAPEETPAEHQERLKILLDGNGISETAVAPGVPVGLHDTTNRLFSHWTSGELQEAGALNTNRTAVLYHFIDGMAKRTAWEANFGDYTANKMDARSVLGHDDPRGEELKRRGLAAEDEDGRMRFYDPSGRYKALVNNLDPSQQEEVKTMLDAVLGRTTSRMPQSVRSTIDWVTAWTGWTVLLFSGIASIPEAGLPAVRAHGRVGILEGLQSLGEARRLARDMGLIMTDVHDQIIWQSMGDNYESSMLNRIGSTFFKYNGQRAITNFSRVLGVSFASRYLLNSAEVGDTQALAQLGVTADQVREWDRAGRPVYRPGEATVENMVAEKVQAAINQFVYEGSSMPSKFQNPHWFNNPYLKMFWMIKRYMYAYGEGVLLGMVRQAQRQWKGGQGSAQQRAIAAAMPFMMFAVATMPLAAAGTEMREWLRPFLNGRKGKEMEDYGGSRKYMEYLFSRSGGFGPLEMALSMKQQSEWGRSMIGSISPVVGKAETWLDWGADGQLSKGEIATRLRQSIPVLSQTPGVWSRLAAVFE